jgi:DNA-binding IclR family transcriptional regulator
VLDAMAAMDESAIGVRELARTLGSPPSSLQRTLESAEELSLLTSTGGRWELGWELFRLASLVQTKRPFQGATAVLEQLSEHTQETALLAVYDVRRHERMFVAASQSHRGIRFVPELFRWLPMHAGASALAILAYRPEEERRALYERGLPALTSTTITSADALEVVLEKVREHGYAVSHDQVNLGACAVAVPVMTASGVTSSVAVIVPRQRFDEELERTFVDAVKVAAASLGQRLGNPLSALDVVS